MVVAAYRGFQPAGARTVERSTEPMFSFVTERIGVYRIFGTPVGTFADEPEHLADAQLEIPPAQGLDRAEALDDPLHADERGGAGHRVPAKPRATEASPAASRTIAASRGTRSSPSRTAGPAIPSEATTARVWSRSGAAMHLSPSANSSVSSAQPRSEEH